MPIITAGMDSGVEVPKGRTSVLIFDAKLKGFFLRVAATGVATYGVDYSVLSRRRRISLGPATSSAALTSARREAERILAKAKLGVDILAERQAGASAQNVTFGRLVKQFLADVERRVKPKTYLEWSRYLLRYLKSLHAKSMAEIERKDIAQEIERITNDHGATTADRTKTAISAFFSWAVEHGHCDGNPVRGIAKRAKGATRSRILEDDELAYVLRCAGEGDYGDIIQLLILSGQRRKEIGGLRWPEVETDRKRFVLPPMRVKNGREHMLPLSPQILEILAARPRWEGREQVFGESGEDGFSNWSRSKRLLDQRITAARKVAGKGPLAPWTHHDLRRSFASGTARLGVGLPVIEKMLNHVGDSFAGVKGIYQRRGFQQEMRAAMELWGEHIAQLAP